MKLEIGDKVKLLASELNLSVPYLEKDREYTVVKAYEDFGENFVKVAGVERCFNTKRFEKVKDRKEGQQKIFSEGFSGAVGYAATRKRIDEILENKPKDSPALWSVQLNGTEIGTTNKIVWYSDPAYVYSIAPREAEEKLGQKPKGLFRRLLFNVFGF